MKGDAGKGSGKSKRARKSKARFHVIPFVNPSGETSFRVAGYRPSGERVRENFTTEEEAIGRKAELDIEAANIITTTATRLKATRLSDEQVQDAERAFAKLGSRSLLDAVEYYLTNYREPVRQIRVSEAVEKFIADRLKQNRRPDTIRNLRGRLKMFSKSYGTKQVSEVTNDDCREFVFRTGTSPRNQINDRLVVANFLNWCLRRQFAAMNAMQAVDKPSADIHEPKVLSLPDCRRLLIAARDYKEGLLLPYVVLSLFAGLRPAEIARLTWDRIDLKEGTITLDGSMAKTRQRRIVKLSENAIAWLLPLAPAKPALEPAAFQRHFGRVKVAAGFNVPPPDQADGQAKEKKPEPRPWIQDYLRHTAISMHLTAHKHEGETAAWAGNSPNVIHRHYKGLVKDGEAKEFWGITPELLGNKITPILGAEVA